MLIMDQTTKRHHLLIAALIIALLRKLARVRRQAVSVAHFQAVARKEIARAQLQAADLGNQLAISQLENKLPDEQEIARGSHTPLQPVRLQAPVKRADNTPLLDIALTGANVVANTAMMEAFRSSAIAVYSANNADGWIWVVEGENPCKFCESMEGTIHPLSEEFESHPNCKCTSEPYFST